MLMKCLTDYAFCLLLEMVPVWVRLLLWLMVGLEVCLLCLMMYLAHWVGAQVCYDWGTVVLA